MSEFRETCEKYQYIPYKPIEIIKEPIANMYQDKKYNFTLNNISEGIPFDINPIFLNIQYKILKYSDNTPVASTTRIAPTSDICRFLYKLILKYDGINILDTSFINYAMNIKNLIEYSDTYSKTCSDVTFFYPDEIRSTVIEEYDKDSLGLVKNKNPLYNKNFHKRQMLSHSGKIIEANLYFNRIEFFQRFYEGGLLPPGKLEFEIIIENDEILLQKESSISDQYKIHIVDMTLYVPKIQLNPNQMKLYLDKYLKNHSFNYLKENVLVHRNLNHRENSIILSQALNKVKYVFIYFSNTENRGGLSSDKFDSFDNNTEFIGANSKITSLQLIVEDSNILPLEPYSINKKSAAYNHLLNYMTKNNINDGPYITYEKFITNNMIFVFDLTKNMTQSMFSGSVKLELRYPLDKDPSKNYSIYCIALNEMKVDVSVVNNKARIIV